MQLLLMPSWTGQWDSRIVVERWEQRGFHQRGPVCGDLRVFGSYSLAPIHASRVYRWGKTDFTLHAGAGWLDGMALLGIEAVLLLTMCLDPSALYLSLSVASSRPHI